MRNWQLLIMASIVSLVGFADANAAIHTIQASGFSFSPNTITINVKDTVHWQLVSGSHTTTNGTGAADPNAGILWEAPLNSLNPIFERPFPSTGTFPFFCRPHEFSGMKGTITVVNANNPPVARDTSLTTPEDVNVNGQLFGTDTDGDPLTYAVLTGPFHGILTAFNANTGEFTYDPDQDFNGEDSLTFEADDGTDASAPGTARITITPENDAPVAGDVNVFTETDLTANVGSMPVTDVDDVTWTVSHTSGPFNGVVSGFVSATGSFDYLPDPGYFGPDSIKYTADDGSLPSNEATIRIDVNSVPVAHDTMLSTLEDSPVGGNLFADDLDGDTLTYAVLSGPFNGSLVAFDPATGVFSYDPVADFNGSDSLVFEATDGISTSATATVRIDVAAVNDPPVAGDLSTVVEVNTLKAVGAMPVTDVDDVAWTITHTSGPFHGVVSGFNTSDGSFDYTPDLDYTGPDSIKYVADDGDDLSDTATIRMTVLLTCDCPCHADPVCEGATDVFDVLACVAVAFQNGSPTTGPDCPKEQTDANCDDVTDVFDVLSFVSVAFQNGNPNQFCDPCS